MDKQEVRKALSEYVIERERIRLCSEKGIQYQTAHPVLKQYRFTNVCRKHDRVSKWLIDNVYSNSERMVNPFLTIAICRFLNWPSTIQVLKDADMLYFDKFELGETQMDTMINLLQDWQDKGNKLITGSYIILLGHRPLGKVRDVLFTARDVNERYEALWDAMSTNSTELMAHEFKQIGGVGDFTAGQLTADLTYIPGCLDKATDLYTFATRGPGSQRGLNHVYGFDIRHKWKQQDFNDALRDVGKRWILPNLKYLEPAELTLSNVQNCMCETSKLIKVLTGAGRPRAKYHTHEGLY